MGWRKWHLPPCGLQLFGDWPPYTPSLFVLLLLMMIDNGSAKQDYIESWPLSYCTLPSRTNIMTNLNTTQNQTSKYSRDAAHLLLRMDAKDSAFDVGAESFLVRFTMLCDQKNGSIISYSPFALENIFSAKEKENQLECFSMYNDQPKSMSSLTVPITSTINSAIRQTISKKSLSGLAGKIDKGIRAAHVLSDITDIIVKGDSNNTQIHFNSGARCQSILRQCQLKHLESQSPMNMTVNGKSILKRETLSSRLQGFLLLRENVTRGHNVQSSPIYEQRRKGKRLTHSGRDSTDHSHLQIELSIENQSHLLTHKQCSQLQLFYLNPFYIHFSRGHRNPEQNKILNILLTTGERVGSLFISQRLMDYLGNLYTYLRIRRFSPEHLLNNPSQDNVIFCPGNYTKIKKRHPGCIDISRERAIVVLQFNNVHIMPFIPNNALLFLTGCEDCSHAIVSPRTTPIARQYYCASKFRNDPRMFFSPLGPRWEFLKQPQPRFMKASARYAFSFNP